MRMPEKSPFCSFTLGALAHFLPMTADLNNDDYFSPAKRRIIVAFHRIIVLPRNGSVEHLSLESEGGLRSSVAAKDELWFDRKWARLLMEKSQAEWAGPREGI